MSILNYTTTVSAAKIVAEIQSKLAKARAEAILTEYEPDGTVSALSFRLPANIKRVYQVLVRDARIARSQRTREHAARVAWRIVKDWVEAQPAMIEAGLVDLEQVFPPYAQDQSGETFYELVRKQKFGPLLWGGRAPAGAHFGQQQQPESESS
jgi:hypothetical protein